MESRNQFCRRRMPMLLKSLRNPCKSLQSMRLCRISSSCKPLWPHSSWCYCRWSIHSKGKKDESLQVASLMCVHRKNVTAGIQREWIFSSIFFLFQTSRSQIPCLMGPGISWPGRGCFICRVWLDNKSLVLLSRSLSRDLLQMYFWKAQFRWYPTELKIVFKTCASTFNDIQCKMCMSFVRFTRLTCNFIWFRMVDSSFLHQLTYKN